MHKKVAFVIIFLCFCTLIFALSAPKKVLSAKDIDTFVNNFEALDAELNNLGDEFSNLLVPDETDSSLAGGITRSRNIAVPAEIQAILNKHGFGNNGFEKIIVITIGYTCLEIERVLAEQEAETEIPPEMIDYFDSAKEQVSEMKNTIHPDDLALLSLNRERLSSILGRTDE